MRRYSRHSLSCKSTSDRRLLLMLLEGDGALSIEVVVEGMLMLAFIRTPSFIINADSSALDSSVTCLANKYSSSCCVLRLEITHSVPVS